MKTVQEICRDFKVTRKTLFYYDRIGLLAPTVRAGKQKAKEYDEEAVCRLMQIQNYRKAGMKLGEIRAVLEEPLRRQEILKTVISRMKEEIDVRSACVRQAELLLQEAGKESENNE